MNANQVRRTFLDFFKSKGHVIVPSAPLVIKNDPTLMFTNAGMNQFKDLFLGHAPVLHKRIADTQKCLRVSGKHNDLEEVGVDTYHHTLFEMLGNWSFGDYFKKEAIAWSWELLTEVYKIDRKQLYVTVFEGDTTDKLAFDQESYDCWADLMKKAGLDPAERIIRGNKKDNFWEMGETGPCGPCSEIHCDIRGEEERKAGDGSSLVNSGHPQVVEIWNNVFMEFNRMADGGLEKLPAQHVDTGMGFERLCMVLQRKQSTYDTDVFQPLIRKIEELSGLRYHPENEQAHPRQLIVNIAMRVIADHIRAIAFSIADGQGLSNTGAGYVIRRILRRAIRYGYQSLGLKEPFMFRIVPVLANQMGGAFPELTAQLILTEKIVKEEELAFFRTLENGLKRIDMVCQDMVNEKKTERIAGAVVFELYDTFGFPVDLTSLIARGYGLTIDEKGFLAELEKQKIRSRAATSLETGDWTEVKSKDTNNIVSQRSEAAFVGYTQSECEAEIVQYRKVKAKNKEQFQLVLTKTPFYAESGGQVGDTGYLDNGTEKINVFDTKKENGITVHFTDRLPADLGRPFRAVVNKERRILTENNHSATHLLHAALRKVLGKHVEQKGSLVNEDNLRFDFSHFSKVTDVELAEIESIVNGKIRENVFSETREMPIEEARKTGAMALFGEKYGEFVRVVTFDKNYSIELCGGTHVKASGQIGLFKIVSEGAVAAGIRRIEAITAEKAEAYVGSRLLELEQVREALGNPKDVLKGIAELRALNTELRKQNELLLKDKARQIKAELMAKMTALNGINFISELVFLDSAEAIKDLSFELKNEVENLFMVLGAEVKGKPSLSLIISDSLVSEKKWNAGTIIRDLAKEIGGGGGGQAFYATAGGTNLPGLEKAIEKARTLVL